MDKLVVKTDGPKKGVRRNLDRLTNLPDPIRSHIVSILPTKEAARISLLSRQWRYICSSLSCMDFDILCYENIDSKPIRRRFKDYVDRMLSIRDGTDIEKFSMFVEIGAGPLSPAQLNNWMAIVVGHKVQNLHLYVRSSLYLALPRVFTCSTLTKLVLVNVWLQSPGVTKLPSLKYLRLECVRFRSEVKEIDNVFASGMCPVLEELEILSCRLTRLSVSLPCIKRVRLGICPCPATFKLSIPNVRELTWEGGPADITSDTFSSLCKATFDMFFQFYNDYRFTTEALCAARDVETLTLKNSFVQSLRRDELFSKTVSSVYFTIKHLHVDMVLRNTPMEVIYFLLPKFCELQTLHIYAEGHYGREGHMDPVKLVLEEKPVIPNLRRVELGNFRGTVIEVDFVKYLFDSASVLEQIDICCAGNINANTKELVTKKMASFSRVSKGLQFIRLEPLGKSDGF